ncbi:MAG: hypothetical protein B7Z37_21110 [Verrucomicrobia bacterium 12-59-8]|nr:MAG: hypothetical protein B7Z37_21110 [Verrucomicrobia bacterium 12-59-8]
MKHLLLLVLALTTLTAHAQDTDGWQTILATEQELKDYPKGQAELADGLLRVRQGNGLLIPQPGPDGAIRARFHFHERTGFPQLRIRQSGSAKTKDSSYYQLMLYIRTGQAAVREGSVYAVTRGKGRVIGTFPLPEPYVLGAYLDLEISVIGDHLQVLVNGKLALELHDSTITTGGSWGIAALEAWFSHIQVRSLTPTPAPGQPAPLVKLAPSTDPRIIQLQDAYTAAIARDITPAHLEALQSLDTKYTAALDRALEVATQAGNLDGALGLRAEKKRVADHAPLPAGAAPPAEPLHTLRLTYHTSLSQLTTQRDERLHLLHEKYLQALEAYQDELTRAKDLDAALEVKKLREAEAASAKAP